MKLYYTEEALFNDALKLATSVAGEVCIFKNNPDEAVYLVLDKKGLWIYSKQFKPLDVRKFYEEFIAKRKHFLIKESLIQAINLRPVPNEVITALDATAGLGRDSILLSLYGYHVTMLESNPYLIIILQYLCCEFNYILPNLQVIYTDNTAYLGSELNLQNYDIIYLDPMFQDNKQALAKKDMQLIDLFISLDLNRIKIPDHDNLFKLAQNRCKNKIIVKRDNKQANLVATPKPTYSKTGKTIRFDVYQCKTLVR